ncbi:MAG: hypothetical protein NTX82_03635, partial [Candidatus Parcubacteria bacterium]|nr:hypothetical protein [Candidatus Parcubacteria bacterium]
LLAAPLPAALTIENIPHPLRFVSALPVFEIIASIGLLYFVNKFEGIKKNLVILIVIIGIIIIFSAYSLNFFKIYPQSSFREFQSGSQEMTEYIQNNYEQYDNFYIINNSDLYIFFPYNYLYYSHIPPQRIQGLNLSRLGLDLELDKIKFVRKFPDKIKQEYNAQNLYLMPADEASAEFIKSKQAVREFNDLNGKTYFVAVK